MGLLKFVLFSGASGKGRSREWNELYTEAFPSVLLKRSDTEEGRTSQHLYHYLLVDAVLLARREYISKFVTILEGLLRQR